ncbi:MAG: hypothetical protein ACP5PT_03990 [Brevinematia bacterium]
MNKLKILVFFLFALLVIQTLVFIFFVWYNNDKGFRKFIDKNLIAYLRGGEITTNQVPTLNDIVSYRIYGDLKDDVVYSVKFLSNYTLLLGSKEVKNNTDLWLIAIDDSGSVIKDLTFDEGREEIGLSLDCFGEDIYLSSEVNWGKAKGDVWFLKLTNFAVEWDVAIVGSDNESYPVIKYLSDESIVCAFSSKTPYSNSVSLSLFHIKQGDFTNIKSFESPISQVPIAIVEVSNGYWIIGETKSFSFGESDIFVASFSKDDELKWFKIYGTKFFESPVQAMVVDDGVLISVSSRIFSLMKLDFDGNVVWIKNYSKGSISQFFVDNDYLIATGTIYDPYSYKNMFVLKEGKDVFWEDFFSFSYDEVPNGIFSKSNVVYLIGNSYSDVTKKDVWFVKLKNLTNIYMSNSVSNFYFVDTNKLMVKDILPSFTNFLVSSTNESVFSVISKYSLPNNLASRFERELKAKKLKEKSKKKKTKKSSIKDLNSFKTF